jgi:hypothetical protein
MGQLKSAASVKFASALTGSEVVFVPGDFLDLGSRRTVDLALHRMVRDGTLRRLARTGSIADGTRVR